MDEKWLALDIGCAECRNWPLVGTLGVFDSPNEAIAALGEGRGYEWHEHPQGGFVQTRGDGGMWLVPLSVLSVAPKVDVWSGDERDAPRVNLSA